ncbi:MAG: efflux RND transporter periplasmic adaptor subunit [Rhodocyclaceae bacterium]|nr:efflux RND transporter periplasmic adaptor subunit [Rhodocyclaceae bacterium]
MISNDLPSNLLPDQFDFQGSPKAFWEYWTETAGGMLAAELVVAYSRQAGQPPLEGWSVLAHSPAQLDAAGLPGLAASAPEHLVGQALREGVAVGESALGAWSVALAGVRPEPGEREVMLCAHVPKRETGALPSRHALQLLGLMPRLFEQGRQRRLAEREATRFSQALEALGRVLEAEGFESASLAFVNELAELFACEQVSLAWMAGEGLKLRALSHSDKLERRSAFTSLLEEAGQEALAQGCEIVWPRRDGHTAKAVTRAHRIYADACQPGYLLSLPLISGGDHLAAVICERRGMPFSQAEIWALRLLCDQVTRPLRDLEGRQRPLYRRLGSELWASLPRQFRPFTEEGRRFTKWLAIGSAFILLVPLPYRIEASFILKTDATAFVGAPFDGYIESSQVTLGMPVKAGEVVFTLATRELMLERAGALADLAQYSREVEKRRAANQLAEMRISEAQMAQTQAKLDQVEYRLSHARVTTPIAGVVVEGEPGKNLGGPVKRGDTVLKVAQVEHLYAEIAVDERDLELVAPGQDGEIMLVANPNHSWDVRVLRVTPSPSVKEGHNTFPVRAEPVAAQPDWWRPGMSGVAKVSTGYRPLLWMVSHRLLDFLRLKLWI